MKPSRKIVVTPYAATIVKPSLARRAKKPGVVIHGRIRQRWKAEFIEHGQVRDYVEGQLSFDDAIGALIRQMVRNCKTADDAFDFIASLFGNLAKRTADVTMSRAVWIAARARFRRNPGIAVEFPDCMEFPRDTKAVHRSAPAGKGGAA